MFTGKECIITILPNFLDDIFKFWTVWTTFFYSLQGITRKNTAVKRYVVQLHEIAENCGLLLHPFKVRFYVTILFQMKQSVICSPLLPCNFFLFKQLHNESMRKFTFKKISSKIDSFVCFPPNNDFTSLIYKGNYVSKHLINVSISNNIY